MLIAESTPDFHTEQPLGKAVRRLRGFRSSFEEQIKTISTRTGIRYEIKADKLTATFLAWLDAFEAQKPDKENDKEAYVGFAAGLMLRSLIAHDPVEAVHLPKAADKNDPTYFWPEGYLYVAYCLNIRGCVLEQEFHTAQQQAALLDDLRTWWSFRENVHEDPSLAIAFLDLFSGVEPNWHMPELFTSQRYQALTQRAFDQLQGPDNGN